MRLLRLIHPNKYDPDLGRFSTLCFRNSTKRRDDTPLPTGEGGISVIDADCIRCGFPSQSICEYISERYKDMGIVGNPIIYWLLPALPDDVQIAGEEGTNSDPCHRNLRNFPDKKSKRFFRHYNPLDIRYCLPNMAGDGVPFDIVALNPPLQPSI